MTAKKLLLLGCVFLLMGVFAYVAIEQSHNALQGNHPSDPRVVMLETLHFDLAKMQAAIEDSEHKLEALIEAQHNASEATKLPEKVIRESIDEVEHEKFSYNSLAEVYEQGVMLLATDRASAAGHVETMPLPPPHLKRFAYISR